MGAHERFFNQSKVDRLVFEPPSVERQTEVEKDELPVPPDYIGSREVTVHYPRRMEPRRVAAHGFEQLAGLFLRSLGKEVLEPAPMNELHHKGRADRVNEEQVRSRDAGIFGMMEHLRLV